MAGHEVLDGLYPFLYGKKRESKALDPSLRESVRQKLAHHREVVAAFFAKHDQAVIDTAHSIADVYRANGRLLVMGNGGSSCDASHVAVEFQHPITAGRPALTAIDLTADCSMMTAVGNDVGFSHIFVRQLIAHARPEDGLIGLSTSGNSENLVRAFRKAKEMGLVTIGLAGSGGGQMSEMGLTHCLVADTDSVHRIQECHVTIYHVLWDLVHTILADDRGHLETSSTQGSRTMKGAER